MSRGHFSYITTCVAISPLFCSLHTYLNATICLLLFQAPMNFAKLPTTVLAFAITTGCYNFRSGRGLDVANDGDTSSQPRLFYQLTSSRLVPVVSRTSLAYGAGVATVLGLGLLSVLDHWLKEVSASEALGLSREVAEQIQAETAYGDFRNYQQALVQYEKDYRQYVRDFHEWHLMYGGYGDAYFNGKQHQYSNIYRR